MTEEERRAQQEDEAQDTVRKQTEADVELMKTLGGWFDEAVKHRELLTQRLRTNLEIHENKMRTRTSERTQIKVNLSLIDVRTQMAIADDYLPSIDIMPADSKSDEYADIMQLAIRQALSDADFKYRALDCIEQSLIMCNGITCVLPKTIKGENNIYGLEISDVDIHTCFPAPGAIDLTLEGAHYIIFATPIHVDKIKRMTGIAVPAEGYTDDAGTFKHISQDDDQYDTLANSALYKECYWIDGDEEKYPCGREAHWANEVLLKDGALWSGFKPEPGKYKPGIPYFMIKNYGTARSWVGVGEPEIVAKIKKSFDETISATADNVLKMGNPPTKVKTSWVNWRQKRIKHTPAEIIEVQNQDDVVFEHGIACPQSTFQFLELLMKVHQYETGVQEVSVGKRDKQAESGRAIMALQEAAESVVRDKINKPISLYMTAVGRQVLWYFQTFDQDKRELPDGTRKDESGRQVFKTYNPDEVMGGNYKVNAVPGVRLKKGRVATEERALNFMELGVYGIEEAVADLNIDNKQGVIDGYYKRQGMQEIKLRYEAMDEAQGEFQKLIQQAFRNAEAGKDWIGTLEEQKLGEIIYEFPELLLQKDFQFLPDEYKARLLNVFKQPAEDIMAG